MGSPRSIAKRSAGGKHAKGVPVSRLCEEIDDKVNTFLNRPLEGDWPYFWLDATYVKVRQGGRIVEVVGLIATAFRFR